MWDEATETLCDLWFVEAKLRSGMVFELEEDYEFVLDRLPEAQAEREKERKRQESFEKYTRDLIAYSRA
jgi:adenylate kinase family enzyme